MNFVFDNKISILGCFSCLLLYSMDQPTVLLLEISLSYFPARALFLFMPPCRSLHQSSFDIWLPVVLKCQLFFQKPWCWFGYFISCRVVEDHHIVAWVVVHLCLITWEVRSIHEHLSPLSTSSLEIDAFWLSAYSTFF